MSQSEKGFLTSQKANDYKLDIKLQKRSESLYFVRGNIRTQTHNHELTYIHASIYTQTHTCIYIKAPSNDAFWEDRKHDFIEVKFYRHMRFLRNNLVLYSLDNVCPYDMYGRLKDGQNTNSKLFSGTYTLIRDEVNVEILTHYCILNFKLKLRDADERYKGRFNVLRIVYHSSRGLQQTSLDECTFNLPSNCDMLFYRHWDFE